MKPGRELDALVAEKVMGHKVFHNHGLSLIASGQKAFDRMITIDQFFWEGTSDENEYCWQLPAYSTDIAAAWQVVEKMKSPFVALEYRGGVCNYELWDCQIGGLSRSADTMPMAICLAALGYVEVEDA